MSTAAGPDIFDEGLILCLDAANTKSYSGSGTPWIDLSGTARNATLYNSPTFSSNNGGTFSWNASTQYADISSLANYNFGSNLTVCVWHYNDSTNAIAYRGVVANVYSSGTGFDMRYGREDYYGGANNGTRLNFAISTSVSSWGVAAFSDLNKWGHYCMTYDGATLRSYKNGLLFSSTSASGSLGSVGNNVTIGRNAAAFEYLNGKLATVQIYTATLNDIQIFNNFNAFRGRFNI